MIEFEKESDNENTKKDDTEYTNIPDQCEHKNIGVRGIET